MFKEATLIENIKYSFFMFLTLIISLLIGSQIASNYLIAKLPYLKQINKPTLNFLYNPLTPIEIVYSNYNSIEKIVQSTKEINQITQYTISIFIICLILLPVAHAYYVLRYKYKLKNTKIHGSAEWATTKDIESYNLFKNNGIVLGQTRKKNPELIIDRSEKHVLLFAPTRSGKGTGLTIPTLLLWEQSLILFDIKKENWEETSGYRKNVLKQAVYKFDPTCEDGSSACFNPLSEIRIGIKEFQDTSAIVNMLITPESGTKKDHWDKTAKSALIGVILHVIYVGKDKSLHGVINLLSDPNRSLDEVLEIMLKTEHDPEGLLNWKNPITNEPTKTHPIISSIAREVLNKSDRERSSVISAITGCMYMFRDPIMAQNTAKSDFSIKDLVDRNKKTSLYLISPSSDDDHNIPIVRIIINLILKRATDDDQLKTNYKEEKINTLFLLDEFSNLGRIDSITKTLPISAGYGLRFCFILQSLNQLKETYGNSHSIVDNCHILIAHATNNIETAELISKMAGTKTVEKESKSISNNHISSSKTEAPKKLLTADEIMRLPANKQLIFVSNSKPIYCFKVMSHEKKFFINKKKHGELKISDKEKFDLIMINFNSKAKEYQPEKEESEKNILLNNSTTTEKDNDNSNIKKIFKKKL